MNRSTRQLSRFFSVILFIISLAFGYFLLQAGSLIIRSLPTVTMPTSSQSFMDKTRLAVLSKETEGLNYQQEVQKMERKALIAQQNKAQKNYQLTKEAYQSILNSRSVTQDFSENKQVKKIRNTLDKQRNAVQIIKERVSQSQIEAVALQNKLTVINIERTQLQKIGKAQWLAQKNHRTLQAFLIRLAFILPLFVLSILLVVRYRKSSGWPFVYGFLYFTTYGFFIELVPYFPSYGGYVRSFVGIVVCVFIGLLFIRKLNAYLAEKKASEAENEQYRREDIQKEEASLELAIHKIIKKQVCPSCDRGLFSADNRYCSYCGLCILKACGNCDTLQISFNAYCQSCGVVQRLKPLNKRESD